MAKRLVGFIAVGFWEVDEPVVEARPAQHPAAGLARRVSTIPLARVPNAAAIEAAATELVDAAERRGRDTKRPPRRRAA
jgi:hypothetical protein